MNPDRRSCFIGLDLGTTTVTGVLLDVEKDEVLHLAQRRNDAARQTALPTRAEQDPRRLRELALEVLAEMATGAELVGGVGLTGQMHGLLCIDAEGQPLTPLISWQDRRSAEPLPGGTTTLAQLNRRLADLDWRDNGCRIQHGYGAATLFWLARQGELPAATHHTCTIADWIAGQLTACPPVTDPTLAASWGVYNLVDGRWNEAVPACLELESRLFPAVRPSGVRLGGLIPRAARQTGLPAGLPVFNTLGDSQAAFLGSVADPATTLLVNLGTGGQICWMVPQFEPPTETVETRPLPHDRGSRYLRMGTSLCGGEAYAWLNRTVRAWLAEFGIETGEAAIYRRLDALAQKCEDTGGLQVRTTLLGVRGVPTVQAGAIEGITLDNLHLGALARATMIGIVDELRGLYQAHARHTPAGEGAAHTRLVAAGGAVRKNPLMPGLLEERFALPVRLPRHKEAAAVGAATLVAHTCQIDASVLRPI